jgi:preprotein translocase subunit SecY
MGGFVAFLTLTKGVDLIGSILVMSIAVLLAIGQFVYYLWRTQRRLPMTQTKSRRRKGPPGK